MARNGPQAMSAIWPLIGGKATMRPPVRSTGSDAAFVAPGQHVKLGQHRGGEPMVRSHFANEPTEAAQQVVNIRLTSLQSDGGLFLKLDQACRQFTGLDRYVPLRGSVRPLMST